MVDAGRLPVGAHTQSAGLEPAVNAGLPAVSVPCGVGTDGLPVGVQVLGPALSEALLLRVAAVIEKGNG